jgi:hypothetical protein
MYGGVTGKAGDRSPMSILSLLLLHDWAVRNCKFVLSSGLSSVKSMSHVMSALGTWRLGKISL